MQSSASHRISLNDRLAEKSRGAHCKIRMAHDAVPERVQHADVAVHSFSPRKEERGKAGKLRSW